MSWKVAGLGNAIMDALVVTDADAVLDELGLVRGTMHPVDHAGWIDVFEKVKDRDVVYESGGSCANTIATLGRLGAAAIYCGRVGDDDLGTTYASRIGEACGAHALRIAPGASTGKCLSIVSDKDAERTMVTDLGASIGLDELGDFADVIRGAEIAHFTGYTLLDGPMQPVVVDAMRQAKEAGTLVSLDVADPFVVQLIKQRLWDIIDEYADIVFLNAEEARALTDQAPEDAATYIAERAKVQAVIVKLGVRGSIIVRDGQRHEIAPKLVEAIDTTGAGDAYAGGYLYGHLQGWAPTSCGALASAVASATVARIGAVVRDTAELQRALSEVSPSA
jgi:sugar/nucleoside kinase (ribokinase family)